MANSPTDQAAAETDALVAELRAQIEARDAFIAVAAHELRNPMTPMLAQVQRLRRTASREGAPPPLLTGLERLESAIEHYVKRATTLLEVTRVSSGQVALARQLVDLSTLVTAIVDAHRILAERAGSTIAASIDPGVVLTLDPLATEQIVDNLLSNAVKYGDGQPIEVRLAAGDATASLTVQDRGVGISPENQQRIFDRFERVIGRNPHGGFGVGLWLVHQLVTAMGGTIAVASVPGAGSTFTVSFRGDEDPAQEQEQ
jgi:signal transduction histidine kinase